jgi:hypothetical protein
MAEHLSPTEQQLLTMAAALLDRLAESPRAESEAATGAFETRR